MSSRRSACIQEARFTGMQQVRKNVGWPTGMWFKNATGNGESGPRGGEWSEQAPWKGNLGSPWGWVGLERQGGGQVGSSRGEGHIWQKAWKWVWEQTASPGWRILAPSSNVYLNSALCQGVCQALRGVGDKIRKIIGNLACLLNNRKPSEVFRVIQWHWQDGFEIWLVVQAREFGSVGCNPGVRP